MGCGRPPEARSLLMVLALSLSRCCSSVRVSRAVGAIMRGFSLSFSIVILLRVWPAARRLPAKWAGSAAAKAGVGYSCWAEEPKKCLVRAVANRRQGMPERMLFDQLSAKPES